MLLVAAFLVVGCGEPRVVGEAGGVPVQLTVEISRVFARELKNRGPGGETTVYVADGFAPGWGPPYWYHGHYWTTPPDPFWDPFWAGGAIAGPPPTTAWLLAGDGPGEARLFRAELDWGRNDFIVLAKPGRVVTFTVQAYGGSNGWEVVGSFTADDRPGQRVHLDLLEHAPRIEVVDPPPPPPPALPPPAAATQPQPAR